MAAIPYLDLSYGTDMTQQMRVRRVQFGDGYSQRAEDGLNAQPQEWRLNWAAIPDATAEALRLFFKERGGVRIIDWTPFGQAVALKWTNGPFKSKPSGYGISDCSVTLTQEFDL